MRNLITFLVAILLTIAVWAQAPQKISYQAVIRNSSDELLVSTEIGIEINIRQNSPTGTIVYTENQTPTTNANGLISIKIGELAGFSTINWTSDEYYIETKIAIVPPFTTYTITGVSQILSVPYALHAKTAENITGAITETDPIYTSKFDLTGIANNDLLIYNGISGKLEKFSPNYLTIEVDSSITNEMQTLSLNINQLSISGTGGNTITFTNWDTDTTNDVTISSNQTITGNKIFTGTITVRTPVDDNDVATKAYVDALLARIEALELSDLLKNGFTDTRDNNHYNVVKIGNQIWMAENLKYLPSVIEPATGSESIAYYYVNEYNGTQVSEAKATSKYITYGVLYNWTAAMNSLESNSANPSGVQGVCPSGWHLPSDAEWTELTTHLSGESYAGGKLKEIGTTHWGSPNIGATNETGFTALGGGSRFYHGVFESTLGSGYWWSATEYNATHAWLRKIQSYDSGVFRYYYYKSSGLSVRCVMD